jgi:hypothetical protein
MKIDKSIPSGILMVEVGGQNIVLQSVSPGESTISFEAVLMQRAFPPGFEPGDAMPAAVAETLKIKKPFILMERRALHRYRDQWKTAFRYQEDILPR